MIGRPLFLPPPCGEGRGGGAGPEGRRAATPRTPLSNSPPQGGRGVGRFRVSRLRFRRLALFTAALLLPTAAAAEQCPAPALEQVRDALEGNRLVQAGRMIERLRRDCGIERPLRELEAAWLIASGRDAEALTRYESLAAQDPDNAAFLAGAGRAAMRLGAVDRAAALLSEATTLGVQDWRAWNALGVLRDRQRQWPAAEAAYAEAERLAPDRASVWNNRGYSLLLQRRTAEAEPMFERALALDPTLTAARNNLEIARALSGRYDEARRPRESARDWSRRLNNQGYAAMLAGDRAAARRLFSKAISASPSRFEQAETNLARVATE